MPVVDGVQYRPHKLVSKDVRGLPMAVRAAATVQVGQRLFGSPMAVGRVLQLRDSARAQQTPENDFRAHAPLTRLGLEPFVKAGGVIGALVVADVLEESVRDKQLPGKCIGFALVPAVRLHIGFVVDRAASMQQKMTKLVHQRERLLRFPGQLLDHDHRASRFVDAEAQDRAFFRDLPLAVVAVAAEYQDAACFYGGSVGIEGIAVRQPQPSARYPRCLDRVLAWNPGGIERGKGFALKVFAKTHVDGALFFHSLDQHLELGAELGLLVGQRAKRRRVYLSCVDRAPLEKEEGATAEDGRHLAQLCKRQAAFARQHVRHGGWRNAGGERKFLWRRTVVGTAP